MSFDTLTLPQAILIVGLATCWVVYVLKRDD